MLSWIAGVEQPGSYHNFSVNDLLILSPCKQDSTNNYYLKYWQGYPFDITFYTPDSTMRIDNATNMLSVDFDNLGYGDRLVVSDGRTDMTLENILPFAEGYNQLRFIKPTFTGGYEKFVTLDKQPYACGVYLKWFNAYGGYSYWLFENTYSIDRRTKHLGEIINDTNNLESTLARTATLGKESRDTIRVIAELLTDEERRIIESILDSPKIYLFSGKPYSQNKYYNWLEVQLTTSNVRLKNPRQPLTNFTFDLELPERYTQTL